MAGRNSCRAGECNRTGAGDPATPSRRIEQLKRIIGSNESGRCQRQYCTQKVASTKSTAFLKERQSLMVVFHE